ncbi:MAG TPA: glycogen debranching enzyme GlgX, partial [Chthoniobacterales bacterium]|nr:glycogen debranching enzyme GlgX [Chthoniobacterales bacterium]
TQFRRQHPVFRRPKYFTGRRIRGYDVKDLMWFAPNGAEMKEADWQKGFAKCVGVLLSGTTSDVRNAQGEPVKDDTFLVLFNAHYEPLTFILPGREEIRWETVINTTVETGFVKPGEIVAAGDEVELTERSLSLLRLSEGDQTFAHEESRSTREGKIPTKLPSQKDTQG